MIKPWISAGGAALLSLAAAAQPPAALQVEDAWVRALPPTQPNTAAYLSLVNPGAGSISVVGASADIAQTVEIHTTREIDGYMRMEQLPGLTLAPGQSLQLSPGGTHLMLLQLSHMPIPGETVRLCLELSGGGEVCTDAGVRKSASATPTHNHHQHQQK